MKGAPIAGLLAVAAAAGAMKLAPETMASLVSGIPMSEDRLRRNVRKATLLKEFRRAQLKKQRRRK